MTHPELDFQGRSRRSLLTAGASLAVLPTFSGLAFGQDKYPSRPIEFVVPWGPGGGADQLARRVGKLLEEELKVSLPIINIPGATGNTGTSKLLSAPPDGQTIAVFIGDTMGTLVTGQARWKLADVAPLGVMIRQPTGLFVKADAKWKTFADLLADAKTNELKAGITGFGSPDEIHINQMNQKGSKFRVVPFASPGERYSSILGGHADVLVEQAGDIKSFLQSKQMRPIVFFSNDPQTGYEDIPLAKNSGFPIAIDQWRSIVMRAGTDPKHLAVMTAAVQKVAASDDFKKYLAEEMALPNSFVPADKTAAFLEKEFNTIKSNLPGKK
ncbi:MAG: tripartite tricarboxylate transporter substrate binding protein [Gammaproteobacteria bacterium]|nr:tripartite tricarboxylate transporter substrate binding protein [Gammaproteobacteria bacterium]MBU1443802.1 tripartite tricarboxylate transporter substrate binding protein [Gammaproteobacteria bacterium]MBU2289396.1 tripartite tricarboxylate transporter substrate binding protein [Gammaproteobacteria bacterium]